MIQASKEYQDNLEFNVFVSKYYKKSIVKLKNNLRLKNKRYDINDLNGEGAQKNHEKKLLWTSKM